MKIQVLDDDGSVMFESDTASINVLAPTGAERAKVVNALHDAQQFLSANTHVITSIKADIQSVVSRIETELGAHPAFTWAQTKLSNAAAHLEHYVKGIWTEPADASIVQDERGAAAVPAAPAAPTVTIETAAAAQATTASQ